MRTIVKFTLPEPVPSMARWPDGFVQNEPLPPSGTADPLDMRAAGCALMRSAVEGTVAQLTFEWSSEGSGALDPDAFVKWWTTKPGWPFETTFEDTPPYLDLAADGESLYGPDVNGRPCSPPPEGTLGDTTPGGEAVNGRPCPPPPPSPSSGPLADAAPPVDGSAEITG